MRVPLIIIWPVFSATGIIVFISALRLFGRGAPNLLFMLVNLLFILTGTYLTLRLWFFRKRLVNFFRHLLSGDYTTGIKTIPWLEDEISALTRLANRVADQLRIYDELRADRTGLSYRALDVVFRTVQEGVIIANMEKSTFRLNPAVQSMFGVNQESFGFESIENQKENTRFVRTFMLTTLKDGVAREGKSVLRLPGPGLKRDVRFRIVPLKDKSEKVRLAMIFVQIVEGSEETQ